MKGNYVLVESLLNLGINTVFGITGGAIIPLYDAIYDYEDKIQSIMCRHEQGATHMAAGYARACGRPSVSIATSGPGGTNMITGIMDAYMDSTPLIAIGGQVPTSVAGTDAFQESDLLGLTIPVTKHNYQVEDANDIMQIMHDAYRITTEGRPGPVYIDLPKDIQQTEIDFHKSQLLKQKENLIKFELSRKVVPDPLLIKTTMDLILKSERPIIIAGGGCIISNAQDDLINFVNSIYIPVNTTIMGKGIFPETHPLSLGVLGMHGSEEANYAMINSDCLIVLGCRFSDRITGRLSEFAENAKIIHIDIDPRELRKNVDVDIAIIGDVKSVIQALHNAFVKLVKKDQDNLNNLIDGSKKNIWLKELKSLKELAESYHESDLKGMTQANLLKIFNKFKKDSDIVTTGVGQHQMFGEHYLSFVQPRTWITSGGAGTMGYGLPSALGAKLARPDSEVYDLDGDGSFQMTTQELSTAKQFEIKVTALIMNNGYLGMVRQWLELFQNKRYANVCHDNCNPDFIKLASAYHLDGLKVTRESEFIEALQAAKKSEETFILDLVVDPEENIFPMLPPAKSLKQIIGGKTHFKQSWEDVKND